MADFVSVAKIGDIPPDEMLEVSLDGDPVVVANVDGTFYAFGGECTHQGGPLAEGFIEGETVTCPWHNGQFNVKTGEVEGPPPETPVATYQVRVEGEHVQVAKE